MMSTQKIQLVLLVISCWLPCSEAAAVALAQYTMDLRSSCISVGLLDIPRGQTTILQGPSKDALSGTQELNCILQFQPQTKGDTLKMTLDSASRFEDCDITLELRMPNSNPDNIIRTCTSGPLSVPTMSAVDGKAYVRLSRMNYDHRSYWFQVTITAVRTITTPATTTADTTTETSTTAETVATSTGTAQTVRQDFECHLNYMHVFIPVDLVPNSQLTLRDPNCRLINNGTHHKISFDYNECGTSQSFYADYISVENDVNVHNIFNDTAEISFVEDYKIPLRCSVDRSKLMNGVIQVMPRDSIQESVVQKTDFYMKEFTTKDYSQEITEYPVKLPINREIFYEIAMTNRSSNSTGVFVEKCEATPSAIPNDTVHVSLIHFGCSVIPAVKVLPAPGIDRFRFSLQAFHFSAPANVSNLVYVHCFASTCGGVVCDNSCLQSSRRRKRSVRGHPSATLTSGSHVVS